MRNGADNQVENLKILIVEDYEASENLITTVLKMDKPVHLTTLGRFKPTTVSVCFKDI